MNATNHSTMRGMSALLVLALSSLTSGFARAQSLESIGIAPIRVGGSQRVMIEDEWAADLTQAFGFAEALPAGVEVAEIFSLLCAESAEMVTDADGRRVPAQSAFWVKTDVAAPRNPTEPVRAVLEVPATALYQLAVEGEGRQRWVVDQRLVGHLDPTELGVALAPRLIPLRRGAHEVSAYLGRRARVDRIELSAFRPLCVAPADGWHTGRSLTVAAVAHTLVRGLGLERYLPVHKDDVEFEGEAFESASAWGGRTNEALESPASGGAWARAGESSAEFSYRLRLDEPAVFSIEARVFGSATQIWSIDGRARIAVQGGRRSDRFAWVHVTTMPLVSGEHVLRALLPRGSGIDLIRVVEHRSSGIDYVDVLERTGFRGGAPATLVTREAALRALSRVEFAELSDDFLTRMSESRREPPLVVVEGDRGPTYSRPVSPVLPAEL